MLNAPISENAHVEIMPDCHAGAGCVIGTTMKIIDKVCPNVVGVDIGCGVLVIKLGSIDIDLESLDNFIKENIPHGFAINNRIDKKAEQMFDMLQCKNQLKNKDRILRSLGSLGGGNHFIEVDIDDEGNKYLLVHCGSRNLGLQVAKHYQYKATKAFQEKQDKETKSIIEDMKAEGNQALINKMLKNRTYKRDWSDALDYVEGELLKRYLIDMEISQLYAEGNRRKIGMRICNFLGIAKSEFLEHFDTIHNYIDTEHMILRKGAVSAQLNERLVIPINMRDGSLLCTGKGNEDWKIYE
jgi:RNA-splicing ligase RtcB